MRLMAALLIAVTAASACDNTPADVSGMGTNQDTKVASGATVKPAKDAQGSYPASKHADKANEIPDQLFKGEPIPCVNERAIANALWAKSKGQLAASGMPQMVDYGVDDVALKEGPGRIAAVEYTFRPGDEGVVSRAADFYLLNEDCRVLYWEYEGP